jgi:hypothetical protein
LFVQRRQCFGLYLVVIVVIILVVLPTAAIRTHATTTQHIFARITAQTQHVRACLLLLLLLLLLRWLSQLQQQ